MTNREKIMAIIKQANDELHSRFVEGVKRVRKGEISRFTNHDVKPYDDMLADMLIEAGIGDCAELTEKWRAMLETQAKKTEEAEHRAEVAERALLTACVNLIKDKEDNVNMELLARVVYTNYLRKAEKELTEEKKE